MQPPNLSRSLAIAYVFFALLLSAVIVWKLPPFMGPDEPNHMRRANMTLFGEAIGRRVPVGSERIAGGLCEASIGEAQSYFDAIPAHPEVKTDPASWGRAAQVRWSGHAEPIPFENTSIYPPTLYLPQTLAILIGKLLGMTVLSTLTLARIANAAACVAVGACALSIARSSRTYLFALLLLPMPVALMATSTQDGLLIAGAALAGAWLARAIEEDRPLSPRESVGVAVCLTAIGMAKLPYALLAFLPLFVRTEKPRTRAIAVAGSLAVIALWHAVDFALVQTPFHRPDAVLDSHAQVAFVLSHPLALASAIVRSVVSGAVGFVVQMIASLGAMDTPMPRWYFILALIGIALSWVWVLWGGRPEARRAWCGTGLLLATALGIFAAMYVSWTPVGSPIVEGVQGRYFLPLAALLPVALARKDAGEPPRRYAVVATVFLLLLPLVAAAVVERALMARYY